MALKLLFKSSVIKKTCSFELKKFLRLLFNKRNDDSTVTENSVDMRVAFKLISRFHVTGGLT